MFRRMGGTLEQGDRRLSVRASRRGSAPCDGGHSPDAAIPAPAPGRRLRLRPSAAPVRHAALSPWLIAPALLFLAAFFVASADRERALSSESTWTTAGALSQALHRSLLCRRRLETVALSLSVTVLCTGLRLSDRLSPGAQGRALERPDHLSGLVAPLLTSIIMRTFGWRVLFARRGLLNFFC